MNDYDSMIKDLIHEWRDLSPHGLSFLKISLERHVIPIIYYYVRREIFHEKLVASEKSFKLKFYGFSKQKMHSVRRWSKVKRKATLSENDFILAAKIDGVFEKVY